MLVWQKGGLRPWRWDETGWNWAIWITYGWLICIIYYFLIYVLIMFAGPLVFLWGKRARPYVAPSRWYVEQRLAEQREFLRNNPPPPSFFNNQD